MPTETTELARLHQALVKPVNSPAAVIPAEPAGSAVSGFELGTGMIEEGDSRFASPYGIYGVGSISHATKVASGTDPYFHPVLHNRTFPEHAPSFEEIVNARVQSSPPVQEIDLADWGQTYERLRDALAEEAGYRLIVNRDFGRVLDVIGDPQVLTEPAAISAARARIAQLASEYESRDREVRVELLREEASRLGRREVQELLDSLAVERGLSWNTVATMLGVSPTAIRKWRRGGSVTPENREQLASLVAFFALLADVEEPIADLGSWVEMRVREDTTLTPAVLYARGPQQRWQLLEWARGYIDAATMLDRCEGQWRETHMRDSGYIVGEGPDGERAIIARR